MKKYCNLAFVLIVVGFLAAGMIRTFVFPKEINTLENRYAYQVGQLSAESFVNGTYQQQMADALNDQVPGSSLMKQLYNWIMAFYEDRALSLVMGQAPMQYVSYRGGWRYGEHLINRPFDLANQVEGFNARMENIAAQIQAHPDVEFYAYLIERDTEFDFETGIDNGCYEYLRQAFSQLEVPYTAFRTQSYEDYHRYYYMTDHHWNCHGSYAAYPQVLDLLGVEEDPLPVKREWLLDYQYYGSKTIARGANKLLTEPFPAYEFDYPEMEITINGQSVADYGNQGLYLRESGRPSFISYGDFYGSDNGETILDTHRQDRPNILILGESYDNALLKLLASHYGKTCSIDLRNYLATMGQEFAFSDYLEEHEITQVLLIGSSSFFSMEEFMLED